MSRTCSSLQGAPLSRLVLWEQVDNGAEKLEIGVNIVLSPALASRSGHLWPAAVAKAGGCCAPSRVCVVRLDHPTRPSTTASAASRWQVRVYILRSSCGAGS